MMTETSAFTPSVVVNAVWIAGLTKPLASTALARSSKSSKDPSWAAHIAPMTLPPETVEITRAR
jgi:hypothetical protein